LREPRVLYRFLKMTGLTHQELVELARRDVREVEDLLMDFVAKLRREGKAPGYTENYCNQPIM